MTFIVLIFLQRLKGMNFRVGFYFSMLPKLRPILGTLEINLSQFESSVLATCHVNSMCLPSTRDAGLVDAGAVLGYLGQ